MPMLKWPESKVLKSSPVTNRIVNKIILNIIIQIVSFNNPNT